MGWLSQQSWKSSAAEQLAQAARLKKLCIVVQDYSPDSFDQFSAAESSGLCAWSMVETASKSNGSVCRGECVECGIAARLMFWDTCTVVFHSQPKNLEHLFQRNFNNLLMHFCGVLQLS